jgi:methylaspartate ammonia-lyase
VNDIRSKLSSLRVRAKRLLGLAAAVLATAGPFAAQARPYPEIARFIDIADLPTAFMAQRGGVSLAQATAMATGRYRGRVVKAETVSRGDRVVHEIRILGEDGKVRTVRIDARTGMFL